MSDQPVNAVDRRLKMLSGLWMEFAELPEARLLRWCAPLDAQRIIETFLEVHKEDPDGVPHLFFFAQVPFTDGAKYADQLVAWFQQYYENNKEGIIEEGEDAGWQCPAAAPGKDGLTFLLQVLASFQAYYATLFDKLALAVLPPEIRDEAAWADWLKRLLALEIPASVRFLIVDDGKSPLLDALAKAEPKKLVRQTPDIDMPTIYRELLKESGGSGPGVMFRKHFVEMTLAGQAGDLAAATARAEAAFKIATENQWPQMQVVAHMGLAAIVLTGDKAQALDLYRQSAAIAAKAAEGGDAVAPKLVVQARMAEASVLFGEQKYQEAGAIYQETGPAAEAAGDPILAMENYRMAAYCLEQIKNAEQSWACATKALDAAEQIPAETRRQTLVHHVGHGMLRLAKKAPFAEQEKSVRERLTAMIGPDWEKKSP